MSVQIKKNNIIMTRGDTLRLKIEIYGSDEKGNLIKYIPIEEDKIRFALKEKYSDEYPLILKEIPWDTMILHLLPEDTKKLKQPAEYVYDIQITLSDGTVNTFIDKARLQRRYINEQRKFYNSWNIIRFIKE